MPAQQLRIPFSGFSHSVHYDRLHDELDEYFNSALRFQDRDPFVRDRLEDEGILDMDHLEKLYARAYCNAFKRDHLADALPSLVFSKLAYGGGIAREVITAEASEEDIAALAKATPREALDKALQDAKQHTSRGPLASPGLLAGAGDIADWPENSSEWSIEQLDLLLAAHLMHKGFTADEFRDWEMDFCDAEARDHMGDWWEDSVLKRAEWNKLVDERDERVLAHEQAASPAH